MSANQQRLIGLLADGELHSGETLGQKLGISRAAVWKAIQKLADYGLSVQQRTGSGYWLATPMELLEENRIRADLSETAGERLALEVVSSCDSTNAVLRSAELPAAPRYRALLSEHQGAGRGRHGRVWRSGFGEGVYLSLGQELGGGLERLASLSLVIGIGACRALTKLGIDGVGLKWPNDLWVDGQKLGGILLEADGEIAGSCRWVAGLGLNWHLQGEVSIDQAWTDLQRLSAGDPPSRNALCGQLLEQLIEVCDQFREEGFAPFGGEWEALDVLAGRAVTVTIGNRSFDGVADGLSPGGELNVEVGSETLRVASGEVSVRPSATA
ncbi:MAG: biotin--[acetyl-CoA-carboxylase] ligase [Pseudomonadota bacterium]